MLFNLLSQEGNSGAMLWQIRNSLGDTIFKLMIGTVEFVFFLNPPSRNIAIKRVIHGRNNVIRVGIEPGYAIGIVVKRTS